MMLWFWLCYKVQHRHVQEICLRCSCVNDKVPRPWSSTARCPVVPSPCPSALGEEAELALCSWGCGTAACHGAAFGRQREAKLCSQASTGHPRRLGLLQSCPAKLGCPPSSICCSWLWYHHPRDTKPLLGAHCLHGDDCCLGDEPSYPGFCGIKWGHTTQGMWDTHVLLREALSVRKEPPKAHVLASKLCLVYLDISFKHC